MVAERTREDKPARIEGVHYGFNGSGTFGLLFEGSDAETKRAAQIAVGCLHNAASDSINRLRVVGKRNEVEAYFRRLRDRGVKYVFLPAQSLDGVRLDAGGAA